jgi:hypothetical protein
LVLIHISRYSLVRTLSIRILRIFIVERKLRPSLKICKIRIKSLLATEYLEIWVGTECASQKCPRTLSFSIFRIYICCPQIAPNKKILKNSNRKCSKAFLTCAFGLRTHITRHSVARRLFIRILRIFIVDHKIAVNSTYSRNSRNANRNSSSH